MTTSSMAAPPASSTASTLRMDWRVCSATVLPTISPVAGSAGIWPATWRMFPLRMPGLSGTGTGLAPSGRIADLAMWLSLPLCSCGGWWVGRTGRRGCPTAFRRGLLGGGEQIGDEPKQPVKIQYHLGHGQRHGRENLAPGAPDGCGDAVDEVLVLGVVNGEAAFRHPGQLDQVGVGLADGVAGQLDVVDRGG